jgi:hypothetical protein
MVKQAIAIGMEVLIPFPSVWGLEGRESLLTL